jgi:hypothetical protein
MMPVRNNRDDKIDEMISDYESIKKLLGLADEGRKAWHQKKADANEKSALQKRLTEAEKRTTAAEQSYARLVRTLRELFEEYKRTTNERSYYGVAVFEVITRIESMLAAHHAPAQPKEEGGKTIAADKSERIDIDIGNKTFDLELPGNGRFRVVRHGYTIALLFLPPDGIEAEIYNSKIEAFRAHWFSDACDIAVGWHVEELNDIKAERWRAAKRAYLALKKADK